MEKINVKILYSGNEIATGQFDKHTSLYALKKQYENNFAFPVFLARINSENIELSAKLEDDCTIDFLDIRDKYCYNLYKKSLTLVMINSIRKILGSETKITIKYSINQNWFFEIINTTITDTLVEKIYSSMLQTVEENKTIENLSVTVKEGMEILNKHKMIDRAKGLKFVRKSLINLYKLENTYDYFYSSMAINTENLKNFKLLKANENTIALNFLDRENPNILKQYKTSEKLVNIFDESSNWAKIIGVNSVGSLNSAICDDKSTDIILTSEALQEKKIANIADMITKDGKKVVLIAGPSSSGKTTFANRLCIQLKVNGVKPFVISLDDYYLDRNKIPFDEFGKQDFESLSSIDAEQINTDLYALLNGKTVDLPKFNFETGKRESGKSIKLHEDEVIIIEGIHGLNEKISEKIDKKDKFKVFISALTQINLDAHNRIATTDLRVLRRMVRDHYFRGFGVGKTLEMWESVKKGEVKNIFPFQDEADVIFNSSLVYEIAVLKSFAEPLLYKICDSEPEYVEATRLIKFLDSFLPITSIGAIPPNSIIREFIGGSCFE